jgi:hypothetical protein
MDDQNIAEWWDALSETEKLAIREVQGRWQSLPPALKLYYNVKGGYFMRRKFVSGLIALAVILIGVAAYFFDQHPLVSIVLLVIGIGLGVLLVWEVESK